MFPAYIYILDPTGVHSLYIASCQPQSCLPPSNPQKEDHSECLDFEVS